MVNSIASVMVSITTVEVHAICDHRAFGADQISMIPFVTRLDRTARFILRFHDVVLVGEVI